MAGRNKRAASAVAAEDQPAPKRLPNRSARPKVDMSDDLLLLEDSALVMDTRPNVPRFVARAVPGGPCAHCQQAAPEMACSRCNRGFHLACAGMTSANAAWICPACLLQLSCAVCQESQATLACCECGTAYHGQCVSSALQESEAGQWRCPYCAAEPLPYPVEKILDWRMEVASTADWMGNNAEERLAATAFAEALKQVSNIKGGRRKVPPRREFYVKWKNRSYMHSRWVSEVQLSKFHPVLLRCYLRREEVDEGDAEGDADGDEVGLDEDDGLWSHGVKADWLIPQRIIAECSRAEGRHLCLVKWEDLGYEHVTWETEADLASHLYLLERYRYREAAVDDMVKVAGKQPKKNKRSQFAIQYDRQPDFLPKQVGVLYEYQLEGLNWLRFSWSRNTNTILADEMGLGKTVQTVAFLYSLVKESQSVGPFLVCVPLSTLRNWERELALWAPELNVVSYQGTASARKIIREFEFYQNDATLAKTILPTVTKRLRKVAGDRPLKFHVLLTSYEMVITDGTALGSIPWEVMVVDEAHRLKNNTSKFFRQLSEYQSNYRLLLTGTPLQNNLEELFHLLSFLCPGQFKSVEDFRRDFADISKEVQIERLQTQLAPHLLRRLKADVLKNMPSKSEFIVCVELAPIQKTYYKHILTKNFQVLNKSGGRQVSLLNVMTELKKICNHPFLFSAARDEVQHMISVPRQMDGSPDEPGTPAQLLIASSGKLVILDKMLQQLKTTGHRVLIFSQMTRMLDILEEYMHSRSYAFERIDGTITGRIRQERIDAFNAPNSKAFVFLLSTRAGGLGINLATADTVIIYDSDWNPHNDIQAFSRAHRIGQENKVMIYRFVSRATVEERIVELAKKKMMLTHLVVQGGMGSKSRTLLSRSEIDNILRFGTSELFAADGADSTNKDGKKGYTVPTTQEAGGGITYDDAAIANLLDRSQEGLDRKEDAANEYLSSFKVARFTVQQEVEPEMDENATADADEEEEDTVADDDQYWEKLLQQDFEKEQIELEDTLGKGKRSRRVVNYNDKDPFAIPLEDLGDDKDMLESAEESEDDLDDMPDESAAAVSKGKRGRRKREYVTASLMEQQEDRLVVLGFTQSQRKAFLKAVLRDGVSHEWRTSLQRHANILRGKFPQHIEDYGTMFLRHLSEPQTDVDVFADQVPKEDLDRNELLERIGLMHLVHNKVREYMPVPTCPAPRATESDDDDGLEMADDETAAAADKPLALDIARSDWWDQAPQHADKFHIADGGFTVLQRMWQDTSDRLWGRRHDFLLLAAVIKHGYGSWSAIQADPAFNLLPVLRRVVLGHSVPDTVSSSKNAAYGLKFSSALPFGSRGEKTVDTDKCYDTESGLSVADALLMSKFLAKRMRLLEKALVTEDQLLRAGSLGLQVDFAAAEYALGNLVGDLRARLKDMQHLACRASSGHALSITELRSGLKQVDNLLGLAKGESSAMIAASSVSIGPEKTRKTFEALDMTEELILSRATKKLKLRLSHES